MLVRERAWGADCCPTRREATHKEWGTPHTQSRTRPVRHLLAIWVCLSGWTILLVFHSMDDSIALDYLSDTTPYGAIMTTE